MKFHDIVYHANEIYYINCRFSSINLLARELNDGRCCTRGEGEKRKIENFIIEHVCKNEFQVLCLISNRRKSQTFLTIETYLAYRKIMARSLSTLREASKRLEREKAIEREEEIARSVAIIVQAEQRRRNSEILSRCPKTLLSRPALAERLAKEKAEKKIERRREEIDADVGEPSLSSTLVTQREPRESEDGGPREFRPRILDLSMIEPETADADATEGAIGGEVEDGDR